MDEDRLHLKLEVVADLLTWLAVYQNIHLALRHPLNRYESAALVMRPFLEQLGRGFVDRGLLTQAELRELEQANQPTTDNTANQPYGGH